MSDTWAVEAAVVARPGPGGWALIADIGGTHARIGAAECSPGGQITVAAVAHYLGADWDSLEAILADYLQRHAPSGPLLTAVLATAGYVQGDQVINENLPWPLRISGLRRACGTESLQVVNDFQALAYATLAPAVGSSILLLGPAQVDPQLPVVVVGPGTGFGCAVRFSPAGGEPFVLSSEAGHISLAAGNERELQVVRSLLSTRTHLATGHAISGPGLVNIYMALCALDGIQGRYGTPAEISAAGQTGVDVVATEALQMLCGWFGSLCGDMAILFGAGAIYLSGGIIPQLRGFLLESEFALRFMNKGVMRPFLENVSVRAFVAGDHGLSGAAKLAEAKLRQS